MINFVIYSHTDYLDVLQIQTDYLSLIKNKTLLINKNEMDINHIYIFYDKIIFYDDSKPYPQRISECLNQITDDYILLCHDIDIIININQKLITEFYNFLKNHNFDRIDLKHFDSSETSLLYICDDKENHLSWSVVSKPNDDNQLYLAKQNDPSKYIYNVNPSIWKRDSILEIMNEFPDKNYREIEQMDVQNFAIKYNIFKIFSKEKKECGHFNCIYDFIFFHISHSGSFVPLNEHCTIYGQSYVDVKNDYENMVEKYNLKNNNKWKN
jgi:hypothetical protein